MYSLNDAVLYENSAWHLNNYTIEFQKLNDERFEFFNSLTEKQTETLNRIVLNILDSTAFNFLREVEENLGITPRQHL